MCVPHTTIEAQKFTTDSRACPFCFAFFYFFFNHCRRRVIFMIGFFLVTFWPMICIWYAATLGFNFGRCDTESVIVFADRFETILWSREKKKRVVSYCERNPCAINWVRLGRTGLALSHTRQLLLLSGSNAVELLVASNSPRCSLKCLYSMVVRLVRVIDREPNSVLLPAFAVYAATF